MDRAATEEAVLRSWLVRIGQLALTVGVTWLIVNRVGLDVDELGRLGPSAWLPNPALLLAATILLLAAYFASAALWGLIVHELGGPLVPAKDAIPLFMIANLGRYVPGKIWQIAGLAVLAKGKGVSAPIAAGGAILGQGIALVAASAVGVGALLGGPAPYRHWGWIGVALVASASVLLSIPSVFRALAVKWLRLTSRHAEPELGELHGLKWLSLYVANWLMYALSFWILARSLGLGGAVIPVASAFAAAYVLGYAMVFAPAGLGPREGFLIAFLTPHLGAAPSGVVAVVARLWTTAVELIPAGLFWMRYLSKGAGRPVGDRADGRGG